jgi:hypothetical protein
MFSVSQIASKQLLNKNVYCFAGLSFGKKRVPTKNDLAKYDVVVVGGNLGNVCATHLDKVLGEKAKIFVAFDNAITPISANRNLYELGKYFIINVGS